MTSAPVHRVTDEQARAIVEAVRKASGLLHEDHMAEDRTCNECAALFAIDAALAAYDATQAGTGAPAPVDAGERDERPA